MLMVDPETGWIKFIEVSKKQAETTTQLAASAGIELTFNTTTHTKIK